MFGFTEAMALIAWGILTFYQFVDMSSPRKQQQWYERHRPEWGPPGSVFPVVWTLLYVMMTVAIFYFTLIVTPDTWQYIAGIVFYLVHIFANKMWSVAFWQWNDPDTALVFLVLLMFPSAVGFIVCTVVGHTSNLFWIPLSFFIVVCLWLMYAAALNMYWVQGDFPTKNK